MTTIDFLAAITWTPGVRGILVVAVGVIVLMGSVYLLLGTNMGFRLGFQVALAGLLGWMAIMGVIWSMYGIGYLGRTPVWVVKEVNYDNMAEAFDDYARLLKSDPRYRAALSAGADPGRFAERLQAGGYATDPRYADKVRAILRSPVLQQVMNSGGSPTGAVET